MAYVIYYVVYSSLQISV